MTEKISTENQYRDYAKQAVLIIEGLILLGITFAFWYNIVQNQSLRDAWFWTLWLAVPIFFLRWKLWGRLWTHTRFHDLMIVFIVLAVFNYTHALYHRESFLAAMARPLASMWTFIYFIELTRERRRLNEVLVFVIGISVLFGLLALTASQWLGKSSFLWNFINLIPKLDFRTAADSLEGRFCSPIVGIIHSSNCFNPATLLRMSYLTFNVNEIGGAMTRLAPVMAGIAIMVHRRKADETTGINRTIRVLAAIAFFILFFALILGQSRFALLGLIVSLTVLAVMALPNAKWRYMALGFVGFIIVLQVIILFNLFTPNTREGADSTGLSDRDSNSVDSRLALWNRATRMMLDYPFSGVGMYMFRSAANREEYHIASYVDTGRIPPHAHNDWLNVGAEMGIPGLILYIAMQLVILRMLWYGWQNGDYQVRTVALATFCGLLSGAVFGIGDTIAIWDRFQFLIWWLLGLAGAQYVLARLQNEEELNTVSIEVIE